ncbi:uncharacterized protein BT62DRAFT_992801 [Guyanagaster necrorhizus]|uniref:Uncharacterized protein n=1 Tax=Guyanagaster necrorhizus TaxID=856835 RepID=A0A9P8AV82_9AGAR|nr:uncharacterized protein BT62DRAFT_992801 [Guyanagaster necrorhizus MCA 3950]KAG7448851.1 hypothetical protein BT62DRAFT_992801 [Guyanagaster necrorhizus MCA 3950]
MSSTRILARLPWPSLGRLNWNVVSRTIAQSRQRLDGVEMSDEPYPSEPPDGKVFEEREMKDYSAVSVELRSPPQTRVPSQVLIDVVSTGNWELANRVRLEMIDNGVNISLNPIFEKAALAALRSLRVGDDLSYFTAWLELCPDASDSALNPFRETRDYLWNDPSERVALIYQFGMVLAKKGYTTLVREEVIPAMEYVSPRYHHRKSMFIKNLKQALLPIVLPTPSSGALIFEEENHPDYASVAQTSVGASHKDLGDHLAELVADRKYEEAKHFLSELREFHIHIPFSPIYQAAAQNALQHSTTATESLEDFAAWFSLVPPYHDQPLEDFTDIRRLIFHAPLTNMSLIIQFALICSEKGYADLIGGQVIPSVMRFASPDVSKQFYLRFEEKHRQYLKRYHERSTASLWGKFQAVMRGSAIRSLAYAGRIDEAVDMLPPKKAPYSLSTHTFDVLNTFLVKAGDPKYLPLLGYLRAMRARQLGQDDSLLQDYAESSITLRFTSQTRTRPYDDRSESLAQTLRSIRTSFSPGHAPPHPSTLINFFNAYVDSGRSRAIDLLRRKALRSSPIATTVFVFTQMITYYRLNQHHLVLQTFVDNFYITGVPRGEVISRLKSQQGVPLSGPLAHRSKMWPTPYHTALIWHSLVAMSSTSVKVEVLYKKLIATACGEYSDHLSETLAAFSGVEALQTPPGVNSVCAAAFTPFMGKLMRSSGVERGASILADMLKLGIQPTAYHFTELAGYYASTGNAQRALFLLCRLETAFDQQGDNEIVQVPISEKEMRQTETVATSSEDPQASIEYIRPVPTSVPNALPVPSFVMYVSLMRGFLISQNLDAVAEVNERMLKRYDYIPGQNSYLDAVYSDWQVKQEGSQYPIRPLPVIKYGRVHHGDDVTHDA